MTLIRTNAMSFVILGTLASLLLSMWAGMVHVPGENGSDSILHIGLTKAAFILASGLLIRYIGVARDFAAQFKPRPNPKVGTRFDSNSVVTVICAFVCIGGAIIFVGVGQFADSAFEVLIGGVLGSFNDLISVFVSKDAGVEETDPEAPAKVAGVEAEAALAETDKASPDQAVE